MTRGEPGSGTIDLRQVAAVTTVVIGTAVLAALVYLLLDILLVLFLGILVAAALQPWHVMLRRWGIPKGLAVLGIYLLLLIGIGLVALIVGPVLLEEIGTLAAKGPATYGDIRSHLQVSANAPFRLIGQRLPPFEHLAQTLANVAPQLYLGAVEATTSAITVLAYFVAVLAVGFYWTMDLPRIERLVLSLVAVAHRARVLSVWHEIEAKLGAFVRGQGMAMAAIGTASAIGYALIGLPNVLVLAVLAGLLEAVPLIGPILSVVPAVIVALPLGLPTVLSVVGFAVVLQLVENNVLVPRIMRHAVGVSPLVSILAILVFGTLYGVSGVLVAIPMTAVIQVLLDSTLINAEPVGEPQGLADGPWPGLRRRVGALRQQARRRLRARTSRMGIDPGTADHVVDAADQQIEVAVARVETIISVAEETSAPMAAGERDAVVDTLRGATDAIEHAASSQGHAKDGERGAIVDTLDQAVRRIDEAVHDAEARVVAAQRDAKAPRPANDD